MHRRSPQPLQRPGGPQAAAVVAGNLSSSPQPAIQILSFLCARDMPGELWGGGCRGPFERNAFHLIPSPVLRGLFQVLCSIGSPSYLISGHPVSICLQTQSVPGPALDKATLGCPGRCRALPSGQTRAQREGVGDGAARGR